MTQASFADDILDASMAQATGGITSERLDALEHTAFVALQRILDCCDLPSALEPYSIGSDLPTSVALGEESG